MLFFFLTFVPFREGDDWDLKEGEIDTLYFPANYINEEVITLYKSFLVHLYIAHSSIQHVASH